MHICTKVAQLFEIILHILIQSGKNLTFTLAIPHIVCIDGFRINCAVIWPMINQIILFIQYRESTKSYWPQSTGEVFMLFRLSRSGLWGFKAILSPCTSTQAPWGKCWGITRSVEKRNYLNLTRETSRGHPNQMPEIPQLTPLSSGSTLRFF